MKKGHTIRKRPLALFMALIMVFGLLPVSGVFAATEQTEEDVVNGSTPQVTSQVKFLNSELTKAEIIYTVNPVKKETGSNIIFLVDASKAAYSTTVKNLVSAMQTNFRGANLLDAYDMPNQAQIIAYYGDNTEPYISDVVSTSTDFLNAINNMPQQSGEDTASNIEQVGLQKAAQAVQTLSANANPTAVIWLTGNKDYDNVDGLQDSITSLKNVLGENNKLITFETKDEPSTIFKNNASTYQNTDRSGLSIAAFGGNANFYPTDYNRKLFDVVSAFLLDTYTDEPLEGKISGLTYNISFTSAVTHIDETLTQGSIPVMEHIMGSLVDITVDNESSNKNIKLSTIDQFTQQDSYVIRMVVDLQEGLDGKQTIIEPFAVQFPLRTGLFDENAQTVTVNFPKVELNFGNNTIAYDLGEGVTGSVEEQTAKVNTQVTLNDGAGITKEGETFGGWYVKQADDTSLVGTRYNGGATITMPNGNITLAPLWGHVGVKLEVGKATPAEPSPEQHSILNNAGSQGLLDFSESYIHDEKVGQRVTSIVTETQGLDYEYAKDPQDQYRVFLPQVPEALYARQIGEEGSNVIAYLKDDNNNGFTLVLTANGGIDAPSESNLLFGAKDTDNAWNANVKSVDLTNFRTDNATTLAFLFNGSKSLETITGIEHLNTTQVQDLTAAFQYCAALTNLDLSSWKTDNVTSVSNMFFQTTQLQTVTGMDTWNMPKLTEARALFAYSGITKVDLSNWNPTELRDFTHVFNGCSNLTEVKIENWEVPYLDGISYAFYNCTSLQNLDLSTWKNTILLTNFNAAFYGCGNLKTLNLSGLVHNYKDCVFSLTFEGLSQLETLNISNWIINGSPYTEWEAGIFVIRGYIDSMTKLIADGWDIQMDLENGFSLWGGEFVTPINYFSQRSGTLEISVNDWNLNDHKVDLSTISSITTKRTKSFTGWTGLSGVTNMDGMFEYMDDVETISITNENLANVSNFDMFSGYKGTALQKIDFSGWTGANTESVSQVFASLPSNAANSVQLTVSDDEIGTALTQSLETAKQSVYQAKYTSQTASVEERADNTENVASAVISMLPVFYQASALSVDNQTIGEANSAVWHSTPSNTGETYDLKATIQFAGNEGVLSGKDVQLRIELPEGMEPTDTSAIITGDFAYFGNKGQYPESGSVITEAELKQENGKWIMTATVGDMFAGTQIEMSFPVKLTSNGVTEGAYQVWDAQAKVNDNHSSAQATYRFWKQNEMPQPGNEQPVINAADIELTVGDSFDPLANVSAYDKNGVDLTSGIKVIENTVDTTKAGEYKVTYTVTDGYRVTATKSIKVTVREKMASGHMNDNLNSAQTGDTTPLVLLAVIGVTAAVLCTAVVLVGRKQKTK